MLKQAFWYLNHVVSARGNHLLHSPFVFDFYQNVLPHKRSEAGKRIDEAHRQLKASTEQISWTDFGAGAGLDAERIATSTIGKIAKTSSCTPRKGEFLHRLCHHYQPARALELGTNLGISALYQCSAIKDGKLITLEGAPELAAVAQKQFEAFGLQPEVKVGEFSDTFRNSLDVADYQPDYVYLDGNHRYQATMDYFHLLLPHIPDGGLIVFDDIYWSVEMKKAWVEILSHPEVNVSIDLFWMGLCFIRRPQAKEHFRFRL